MTEVLQFPKGSQEVSSEQNGGKILFATDDFFAVAENLLKPTEPIYNDNFTEFGKWMDGWETRRKRIAGHDWAIIALGEASTLHGACVDTAFFTGNYAPRFSLQAAYLPDGIKEVQSRKDKMGTAANDKELEKVSEIHSENWETILPMESLKNGDPETRRNYFKIDTGDKVYTHLRFNIFPDGGVARLKIYGKPAKSIVDDTIGSMKPATGKCISCSNAHYTHPDALLRPEPSTGMHDGWETARKLDRPPTIDVDGSGFMQNNGEEWAILKLDKDVCIKHIEVDTNHFKGNCPDNVRITGAYIKPGEDLKSARWIPILNRTKLMPHQNNGLKHPCIEAVKTPLNHVKVIIAPDGGLARVRIYGTNSVSDA